tara:strand:- start:829 stop:1824 length:996 start_codon:yes stop_codon:yes gene_type:complete
MIVKSYELVKLNIKIKKLFLFYGENQGLKNEIIEEKFKKLYSSGIYSYEENEILNSKKDFFNTILSKSFFENDKLIIINRATDRALDVIEEVVERRIEDLVLVLNANNLDKKSKIRSYFEKSKYTVCVPFYEDNNQTLSSIVSNFFRKNKTQISQQAINLIVGRCSGDRQNLNNELQKLEVFIKDKDKIEIKDILKLTNLVENYSVSELIDNCLAKNTKKTLNILNENNYSLEDCILIIRTFLIKSKRLLKITKKFQDQKNIEAIILSSKPPIFWKDKEIVKQQVQKWSINNVENLIYKINKTELLLKKNSTNSINILFDFIIEQATVISN